MSGYYGMPPTLYNAIIEGFGSDIAEGASKYWNLLVMGCMIMAVAVIIHVGNSLYKKYKYNRPDLGNGALLKFFAAICLANINYVVQLMIWLAS